MLTRMSTQPTQIRLVEYPDGIPDDDTWDTTHDQTPDLTDGQVEVEVQLISVDPGMKGWISPWRSYIDPVEPGEVMRAFGIGPVTRSASSFYSVGDVVSGFTSHRPLGVGWRRLTRAPPAHPGRHRAVPRCPRHALPWGEPGEATGSGLSCCALPKCGPQQ